MEASKLPHSTIRTRIALVYGGVFLVLGTALLATVNLASRAGTETEARAIASSVVLVPPGYTVDGPFVARGVTGSPTAYELTDHVTDAAGKQLMNWSFAALLVMTAGADGVGWWIAGRVLRPVHAMTAKARRLSERTLHQRIASSGPDDELKGGAARWGLGGGGAEVRERLARTADPAGHPARGDQIGLDDRRPRTRARQKLGPTAGKGRGRGWRGGRRSPAGRPGV
ncbi:HAMP domain-containing histidine kinase [Streptomyces californicus]